MLTVGEAWRMILESLPDFGTEGIAVADCAGRILRQQVCAERDQPPFDRVMMDGVALRHSGERRRFRIQGAQHAGDPVLTLENDSHCIEIMTGSALPVGADTVVPVERFHVAGDYCELESGYQPEKGQFIHPRASDHAADTPLLAPGQRLGSPEVAVLASQGLADVEVGRQPPVAVVSTGNELVGPGRPLAAQQIRMSNGAAILAALRQHGFAGSRELHIRDERATMQTMLGALLEEFRVLILSGGVSRGKADYVPEILAQLGVEVIFHRIAQRPGKPMWFGTRGHDTLVFALPGNPVSTLVCFRRYVLPALLTAAGLGSLATETALLGADYEFSPALTCFLPVRVQTDADASLVATPVPTNTSGDFTALAGTSGFLELPLEDSSFPAGTPAPLYRWQIA